MSLILSPYFLIAAWTNHTNKGPPFSQAACPPPSTLLPPGAYRSIREWVRLNHLCCNTTRVGKILQCVCNHPLRIVLRLVTDCESTITQRLLCTPFPWCFYKTLVSKPSMQGFFFWIFRKINHPSVFFFLLLLSLA